MACVRHACLVAQSCPTLCDPMDCILPAPLSIGFSRQEYWSGFPCPPPGDLPDPGLEPESAALQADSLPPGSPSVKEVKAKVPPTMVCKSDTISP